jgi:hypothetical protein
MDSDFRLTNFMGRPATTDYSNQDSKHYSIHYSEHYSKHYSDYSNHYFDCSDYCSDQYSLVISPLSTAFSVILGCTFTVIMLKSAISGAFADYATETSASTSEKNQQITNSMLNLRP